MKIHLLTLVLAAAVAFAPAAEAASTKRKKGVSRTTAAAVKTNGSYDVYSAGELVGRDPDPFIRMMLRRDPKPGQGEQ